MKNKLNLKLKFAAVALLAVTLLCTVIAGLTGFFDSSVIKTTDAVSTAYATVTSKAELDAIWDDYVAQLGKPDANSTLNIAGDFADAGSYDVPAGAEINIGNSKIPGIDFNITGNGANIYGAGAGSGATVGNVTVGPGVSKAEIGDMKTGDITLNGSANGNITIDGTTTDNIQVNSGTANLSGKISGTGGNFCNISTGASGNIDNASFKGGKIKLEIDASQLPSDGLPHKLTDSERNAGDFSSGIEDWYIVSYRGALYITKYPNMIGQPKTTSKSYVYDGLEFEPAWDIMGITEDTNLSVSGDTKKTNVGSNYTIKVELSSTAVWVTDSGFSRDDLMLTWSITKATMTLNFKYGTNGSGTSASPSSVEYVENGNTEVEQTTDKTTIAAGIHKGKEAKTAWDLWGSAPTKGTLTFSTSSTTVVTVDGATGTISHVAQGNFTVTATLSGNSNINATGTCHGKLTPALLDIPTFTPSDSLTYTGSAQNRPKISFKYKDADGKIQTIEVAVGGSWGVISITEGGTNKGTNCASYEITLTTDGKYVWKEPGKDSTAVVSNDSKTVTLTWYITKVLMNKPTLNPSAFQWTGATFRALDNTTFPAELTEGNYTVKNKPGEDGDEDPVWKWCTEESAVGNYRFEIILTDDFYKSHAFKSDKDEIDKAGGLQSVIIEWSIFVEKLVPHIYYEGDIIVGMTTAAPGVAPDSKGVRTWSISSGDDLASINPVTGALTAYHAGTITVKLVLGPMSPYPAITYEQKIVIQPYKLKKPTLVKDRFEYNLDGTSLRNTATRFNGFDGNHMRLGGDIEKISVDNYSVTVSLINEFKNAAGQICIDYVWGDADGNNGDTADIKIPWEIYKSTFKPVIKYGVNDAGIDDIYAGWATERFYCTGYPSEARPTITWSISGSTLGNPGSASIGKFNGIMSPSAAGYVTVVVTVSNYGNYEDGTATRDVYINPLIQLKVPKQSVALTYNMQYQSPTWSNYPTTGVALKGNHKLTDVVHISGTTTAKNANADNSAYQVTFTIDEEYKKYYTWETGDKNPKTVDWTIAKRQLTTLSFHYQVGSTRNHIRYGSPATPTIDTDFYGTWTDLGGQYNWTVQSNGGTSGIDELSGALSPTRIGEILVTLSIENYNSNYVVTPKPVTVTIDKLLLHKPEKKTKGTSVLSPDFTYNDGKQLTLEFNYFDETRMKVTGHVASVVGTYKASIDLIDHINTDWETNGSSAGVWEYTWYVGRATVRPDSIQITYGTITYGTDSGTPAVTGDKSEGVRTWTIKSNTSPIAAKIDGATGNITPESSGNLTIHLYIAETSNYYKVEADCTVFVHKKAVEVPKLEGTYTWNGASQTVAINSAFQSGIMNKGGTLSATAANNTLNDRYSVTITFSGNNGSRYRWNDVEETDTTASTVRTLYWRIERAELELPKLIPETVVYSTAAQTTELSYIEYLGISVPSVPAINSSFSRTGKVITIPAGTPVKEASAENDYYPITVTPDSNHRWKGSYDTDTKTLKLTVTRAEVNIDFSYAETVIFDKDSCVPDVTGNLGRGAVSWSITNLTGNADINKANGVILKPSSIGTVEVTITVADTQNYKGGTKSNIITVNKATYSLEQLNKIKWVYDQGNNGNYVYNGTNYSVSIKTDTADWPRGIVIKEYEGNVGRNADQYTASVKTFTWDPNYNEPTLPEFVWNIQKANISNATVAIDPLIVNNITYNGGLQKPAYSVSFLDIKAEDYAESWANNINAGNNTASLTVTANGSSTNFTGSKTIYFTINKADYNTEGMVWNYSEPFVYSRGVVRTVELRNLPVNVSGVPIGVTYTENSTYTHNRTDYGTYRAQAVFTPDPNYNNLGTMTLDWQIDKANYNMSGVKWDYTEPFVYESGTQREVKILASTLESLPKYISSGKEVSVTVSYVSDTANRITNKATVADKYIARAVFTYDSKNYNVPVMPDLEWEIKQAPYDASNLAWNYTGNITYDGQNHSVRVKNLPSDLRAVYGGQHENIKNAGVYTATVTFTCTNPNYAAPELQALVWKIEKASYDMTGVIWNYTTPFTYATTSFLDPSKGVSTYQVALSALPTGKVAADNLTASKVTYTNASASAAGTYTASVKFDYDDTNYLKPSVPNLVWKINKQSIDKPFSVGSLTYNGSSQSPESIISGYKTLADAVAAINNAQNVTLSIGGDTAGTNAGKYTTTFKFTDNQNAKSNYQWSDGTSDDLTVIWYIDKAVYDMSGIKWQYAAGYTSYTYDGAEKTVTIVADSLPLKNPGGTERISVELYTDNSAKNAGTYFANVKTFKYDDANYYAPVLKESCEWTISKADISNAGVASGSRFAITANPETIIYTGSEIRPEYIISYLTLSRSDYDVLWSNNINAGTATLTLVARRDVLDSDGNVVTFGSRNFTGNTHVNFVIKPATFDMSNVGWYAATDLVYNGSVRSVALRGLPAGVEVEQYFENEKTDAGNYCATALLKYDTQNYNLVTVAPYKWTISRALLTRPTVDGEYVYDRTAYKFGNDDPNHNLVIAGYDSATMNLSGQLVGENAGDYTLTVAVKDPKNYEWSDTHTVEDYYIVWTIDKDTVDASGVVWNYSSSITYDGKEHTVLIEGLPDYIGVTYYGNIATVVGQYRASVTLHYNASNYNEIKVPACDWEITKADISNAQLTVTTAANTIIYNGTAWRPSYSINYLTLNESDYTVSYANNTQAGYATLTVTAKATSINFEGSKTVQFQILKADFDIDDVSWNYSTPFIYDGSEKTVALRNVPQGLKAVYSGEKATNASYKDGVLSPYTATAALAFDDPENGLGKYSYNYNLPESTWECEWIIERATYDMTKVTWDYKSAFLYDGSAKSVNIVSGLPKGINVTEYESKTANGKVYANVATDAGIYYAQVKTLTYDSVNYNKPTIPEYKWEIEKAHYDMTNVAWDYASVPFIYDGTDKTVSLTGLPVGVTVKEYLHNSMKNAGTYEARVISLVSTDKNYYTPEFTKPCNWEIVKADLKNAILSITTPANDIVYKGADADGNVQAVQPEFSVNYLTLDASDYDVIWTNNINASTATSVATLTLKAKNESTNFQGEISVDFIILKATFDMSRVSWNYSAPLEFNGQDQFIFLKDLPNGLSVKTYAGNKGQAVGAYTASVEEFDYDKDNYNAPVFVINCNWEIAKKNISDVMWEMAAPLEGHDKYFFNGETDFAPRAYVELEVDGETVRYYLPVELKKNGIGQTSAINAGEYIAIAVSNESFNLTEYSSEKFTVNKLPVNAGEVKWKKLGDENIDSPDFENGLEITFKFNGENQMPVPYIILNGTMYRLPFALTKNGASATSAINAGSYTSTALSGENFEVIEIETISFEITKAEIDLSKQNVKWSLENDAEIEFDGTDKAPTATVEFSDGKIYEMIVNLTMDGIKALTAVNAGSYTATVTEGENFVIMGGESSSISFFITPKNIKADEVKWNIANNSSFTFNGTDFTPKATYSYNGLTFDLPVVVSTVTRGTGDTAVSRAVNAGNYIAKISTGGNFEVIDGESFVTFDVEKFGVTADNVEWSFDEGTHFAIGEMPYASALVRIGGKEYSLAVSFEKVGGSTEGWTEGTYIATVSPVDGENNIALVGAVTRSFQIADDVANSYNGAIVGNEDGNAIWWFIFLGFNALVFIVDLAALIIAIIKYRKSKSNEKTNAGEKRGDEKLDAPDLDPSFAEPVTDADNF